MRKFVIVCVTALLYAVTMYAQDPASILNTLHNAPVRAMNAKMSEVRTFADKTRPRQVLKGDFVWKSTADMSIMYANSESFVLEGDRMTVVRDGSTQVYDLSKNLMMKGLASALRCSFEGRLDDLARDNDAEITAVKDGSDYVVTLTARKKSVRGLSLLIAHYSVSTCTLKSLRMDEFSGASTFYTLL